MVGLCQKVEPLGMILPLVSELAYYSLQIRPLLIRFNFELRVLCGCRQIRNEAFLAWLTIQILAKAKSFVAL